MGFKDNMDRAVYSCFGRDSINRNIMEDVFSDFIGNKVGNEDAQNYLDKLAKSVMDEYYIDGNAGIDLASIARETYVDTSEDLEEANDLFSEEVIKAYNVGLDEIGELSYRNTRGRIKESLNSVIEKIDHPYSSEDKFVSLVLGGYIKDTIRKADNMDFIRSVHNVNEEHIVKQVNGTLKAIKITKDERYTESIKNYLEECKEREMGLAAKGNGTELYNTFLEINKNENYDVNNLPFTVNDSRYIEFIEKSVNESYIEEEYTR